MLMARFLKKQVLASNALLHYLLPEPRDNNIIRSLINSQPSLNQSSHNEVPQIFPAFQTIVWKISQVHCDFVLHLIVLTF